MLTSTAYEDSLLSFWPRVRDFAVPPTMIETATVRRRHGDWAGACAAAGFDIDFDLRSLTRTHGRELVSRVRSDLRHLAPDLLRWHMPRVAPDGLLRPGLTVTLARYDRAGRDGVHPVHLVARTPPAWADGGQRIGLALWDGAPGAFRDRFSFDTGARRHPHPRPSRWYRFDLHRHLWDTRRTGELRVRCGADLPTGGARPGSADPPGPVPGDLGCAVGRWADEAGILLRDEGRTAGTVTVRLGARRRLLLELAADPAGAGPPVLRTVTAPAGGGDGLTVPALPDAATWVLPDLALIRAGVIGAERLHPLVAPALVPGHTPAGPEGNADPAGVPRLVECRGADHRIGLVDGVLVPLDHDPAEIRREELLVALTGTPLPCLRAIDEAHRRPHCLPGVRERLRHGDTAGALAVVEALLGPDAVLRDGALRDELQEAALRRVTYGLFRAGLTGPAADRVRPGRVRPRDHRSHPRETTRR
ncbi:hypothetical protein [Streptomyces triticiradicis]|uniref:Uncharacterized protein n=1 Tax=Streptomyces triticiradicis TaxID=2651189 RepID=A0A7J5DK91_9ACTN|nr:hypothetical protein [Streptomyces triticiradicis]KAB1989122.1 hypothetical protein F8144_08700 [Streptomyces triticiradicis]